MAISLPMDAFFKSAKITYIGEEGLHKIEEEIYFNHPEFDPTFISFNPRVKEQSTSSPDWYYFCLEHQLASQYYRCVP